MCTLKKKLEQLEQLERLVIIYHLKSRNTMRYDITKASAPKMSGSEKDTECTKIVL